MFKITTKPPSHQASFVLIFSHPLDVHTVRTCVFFTIVLPWDLVQAKIYKFEIQKRGLVVKLDSLTETRIRDICN